MRKLPILFLPALWLSAGALPAQGNWGLGPIGTPESKRSWQISKLAVGHPGNVNYDGRWTYARIAFTATAGNGGFGGRGGFDPKWDHDYPNSDKNLPTILSAISNLRTRADGSVIVRADDPDLYRFPFAYLCEVGFWNPTDAEAKSLGKYLVKGGFLIIDDFQGPQTLENFKVQIKRVIPNAVPVLLPENHAIFDAFYRIKDFSIFVNNGPGARGGRGGRGGGGGGRGGGGGERAFYGIFENNDPTRRMYAIVNHNFDVSEYWEYSATGVFAVDATNEAYKLGVNYVFYTITR